MSTGTNLRTAIAIAALAVLAGAFALTPETGHGAPANGVERIVFMSSRGSTRSNIWSMAPDGSDPVQLTFTTGLDQDYGPRISPDGRKIAFVRYHNSNYDIWVMDSDGTDAHNITDNPASDQNPSWSPDGTKIAFESDRDDFFREIYVMDADGSNVVRRTDDDAYDGRPAWSPDGTRIAFESQRSHSNNNIFAIPAGGGSATNLTPWDWDVYQPAWSPDGNTLAVSGEGTAFLDVDSIWTIPLGGGYPVRLSTNQGFFPRYSPDGTHIVFSSDRDAGLRQIYVIGATGGSETPLSTAAAADDLPDWGYLVAGEVGDISGDGAVDEGDLLPFLAYLAGTGAAPPGLANGDLDCNGSRDQWDMLGLLWYLAGITNDPQQCLE